MSNREGRGGLGLLVAVVLLGLGLLIVLTRRGEDGRRASGGAPEPLPTETAGALLAPAGAPTESATTLTAPPELEPFEAGRGSPPAAGRGSLRGHVEVRGEEAFPLAWELVLQPSATLPQRETAETRTLSFARGEQDFVVEDLPHGGYDVHARAAGFNGALLAVQLETGNEHPFVNLQLSPAGLLEGRVLEHEGLPAEGIPITLFALADGAVFEARSDALGIYRFESLPDGAYELLIGKPSAPLLPERRPVRFSAPSLTFPDVELPLLGTLAVRVVDSLERPLEGVLVRGSGSQGGLIEGATDYDGRLVARHLPAGHFRLRLSFAGQPESREKRFAVDVVAGEVTPAPVRMDP